MAPSQVIVPVTRTRDVTSQVAARAAAAAAAAAAASLNLIGVGESPGP